MPALRHACSTPFACWLATSRHEPARGAMPDAVVGRVILGRAVHASNRLLAFDFFFNYPATTQIYPLSLHDALPICNTYGLTKFRKIKTKARFYPYKGGASRS